MRASAAAPAGLALCSQSRLKELVPSGLLCGLRPSLD